MCCAAPRVQNDSGWVCPCGARSFKTCVPRHGATDHRPRECSQARYKGKIAAFPGTTGVAISPMKGSSSTTEALRLHADAWGPPDAGGLRGGVSRCRSGFEIAAWQWRQRRKLGVECGPGEHAPFHRDRGIIDPRPGIRAVPDGPSLDPARSFEHKRLAIPGTECEDGRSHSNLHQAAAGPTPCRCSRPQLFKISRFAGQILQRSHSFGESC